MHNRVNTFILGAQKAGTTWISNQLKQHPDIFVPPQKEIHYFDKPEHFNKGPDWYLSFYKNHKEPLWVDATPNYLWTTPSAAEVREGKENTGIPALLAAYNPEARFIVSLRDPVSRAVSAFYHHIRVGRISPRAKFEEQCAHFGIESMGYYHEQLQEWLKYFDREQFLFIILEEDIAQTPKATLSKICDFLKITPFAFSGFQKKDYQRAGHDYLRIRHLHKNLGAIYRRLPPFIAQSNLFPIKINEKALLDLEKRYRKDTASLSALLNRSLPWRGQP